MPIDITRLRILRVTPENSQKFAKLLQYFGYGDFGPTPFEAQFLLYGNEIIQNALSVGEHPTDRRSAQEDTEIVQQIFHDYPVTNVWDVAFNLRLLDYAEGHYWTSMADLRRSVAEKAIQDPFFLPFVCESRGIILWRHQAQNILGLFFENRHVIDHYIRDLHAKRIPTRERLNQVKLPTGGGLADFLAKHSFHNGIFLTPNFRAAMQLWKIMKGIPHVSLDLEKIMEEIS